MNNIKRYDKYKDSGESWIEDIPYHWDVVKLKHLFSEKKIKHNPDLSCGSISFGEVITKADDKIPKSTKASYQEVLEGEFLINPLNLNYDLKSLRIALSKINVVVSSGYIVLNNISVLNKQYYKYFLYRYDVAYMKLLGSGVRQTINFNHIADSLLLSPPLPEQTSIVNFLDEKCEKIDRAITQKEKLIKLLKEQKQILIQNAVTKGLDPNVKMKDSGFEWIGEIPEHWDVKRFRLLGKTQNGISAGAEYFGKGFPFVSYGDVYKNRVLPITGSNLADSPEEDRKQYSVEAGDIFFTRTSETIEEIGMSSVCHSTIKDATFSGFLIRFRPNNNELSELYSEYFFSAQMHRAYFVREMNLVTRASLSQELLKDLPVFLPPKNEQLLIATYLTTIQDKINKALEYQNNQIQKLKEYKSTLINSTVTGKIKVV